MLYQCTEIQVHRPTAWINNNNGVSLVHQALALFVPSHWPVILRSVIKCLTNARKLGTVIIITNAESGWVEVRLVVVLFLIGWKNYYDNIDTDIILYGGSVILYT